jgi:glycosyltransferase involved in cell wall biosynthesis
MNKENTLVSIIVRTKDRPKLLKNAIKSIAAQTYRPIEVVLVNDGGCDLDIEELKGILGDISLNYIRLERNTGRAHAGNIGIENVQGEYIGFLDDDDEYLPEHIETLITFLEQSDYKIAYTDTEMTFKEFSHEAGTTVELNKFLFSKDFSYSGLLISNYIPFNSLCFSKDVLKSVEKFDEDFDLYEDWDLLIRMGEKHSFYHIEKKTAIYNQWSKQLQINLADKEHMKAMFIKIVNKHREQISPLVILKVKEEKEKLEYELNDLSYRYNALREEVKKGGDNFIPRYGISSEIEEAIKGRDIRISELEYRISEKNDRILNLERKIIQLEAITNTLGWQMLESFRRLKEKILPTGTLRGKVYDSGIKVIKVLKNEGVEALLQKIKHKTGRISYDKKSETMSGLLTSDADRSSLIHFPSKRNFNMLFIKGEWAGLTNHYRVDNMIEYLKLNGIYAEAIDILDLPSKIPFAYKFDIAVIHRIPMNPTLHQFIKNCKECNIVVVFDLDDYLFEPSVIHLIEWVKQTKSTEKEQLIEHIKQCRQTFDACDYFVCPTDFLAKKAEELGRKAYVIRNGLSSELVQTCLKALEGKSLLKDAKTIKIGYFSGTNTHQKDFHSVAPVLLRILKEYNHVNLYICGLLELDNRFNPYMHKIEKSPFVPLEQLPYHISKIDINTAPLESGNIFCESKSELKYFYAGMLKIPTIASPTDAFQYAIKNGENGFLASNAEEWYTCLKALIENNSLRENMGKKAFIHVRNTYVPEILAYRVRTVYKNIIDDIRLQKSISEKSISINVLISDIGDNFERYQNLREIADILSKKGHFVRLYFYKTANISSQNSSQELTRDSKFLIISGMDNILSSDILVCTDSFNSSVIAYQNKKKASKLVYFKMDKTSGEIPYKWADFFTVIPYSPNFEEVVTEIEHLIFETVEL